MHLACMILVSMYMSSSLILFSIIYHHIHTVCMIFVSIYGLPKVQSKLKAQVTSNNTTYLELY